MMVQNCVLYVKKIWSQPVVLGWDFDYRLPKAMVLKVPHHGASNALQVSPIRREHNYLDVCSHQSPARSVLFAGDARHPDPDLFRRLRARTGMTCISDGLCCSPAAGTPPRPGHDHPRVPGGR